MEVSVSRIATAADVSKNRVSRLDTPTNKTGERLVLICSRVYFYASVATDNITGASEARPHIFKVNRSGIDLTWLLGRTRTTENVLVVFDLA